MLYIATKFNDFIILCYCKLKIKGILPVDQEAVEAVMSLEQPSTTLNEQDSISESSQSD